MRRGIDGETVRATPEAPAQGRADASPELGRLGRYELLFELARGGLGRVHVACLSGAHGFDRLVAIKRLSGSVTDEATTALLAEARLTAKIRHPNVVQTLELGEHDGSPFIVMELVEGVSLARLLDRLSDADRALPHDVAAWVVAQAALGLHAAHELRGPDDEPLDLVHRDVSPQNLLVSFEGRVKLADFGVAKLRDAGHATESGVVKGKFAYMSPEQTRAEPLDRRSDVFSLGVVLHESLTGRRLFAGTSPADTIRRVIEERPADPRGLVPAIPPSLAAIAMRCLEKDKGARFASAAEVADAIRRDLRERGAAVDEADVAALCASACAEEGESLRARLRARGGAAPAAAGEGSGPAAGRHGSVTAAITRARTPAPASRVLPVAAAIGVLGAAAWWWSRPAAPSAAPSVSAAPTVAARPAPSPAAPDPEPAAPPTAAARAEATVEPSPARSADPDRRRGWPRGAAAATQAAAATTAPPSAAPAATAAPAASHGGVPFRTLDP